MEHYVTLFDSPFLPQGLALQESLETHGGDYTLWIICVDDVAHSALSALKLRNVRLLGLSDVETPELLRVKPGRTRAEYCWTLTPYAPKAVWDAEPEAERVTYVDADLWFRASPARIFREFSRSGAHVLITPHAYAPEHDYSATSGYFCVQFMSFTRAGENVRRWWQDRCLEWCYARSENGKFGDQKYLDDWPDRFHEEVHVLEHEQLALAPWNATRFPYGGSVMYHFHGLRLQEDGLVDLGEYPLPPVLVQHVYEPYLAALRRAIALLRSVGFEPRAQSQRPPSSPLSSFRRIIGEVYAERWRLKRGRTMKL